MLNNNRGQATIETLIAVSILLFLLVLILWQVSVREQFNNSARDTYSDIAMCNRISAFINLISHNPRGESEIIIELDRNVTIANRTITVGDQYCLFYANAVDVNLDSGMVKIYDLNGVVYLENTT